MADQHGLGDQLAEEIEEAGGEVTLVRTPDVETNDPATWDQIINSLSTESLRGVVYLWSLDLALPDLGQSFESDAGCERTLALFQSLARAGVSNISTCLVSRHAISVNSADVAESPQQAPMWGLGRVAANEHPELGVRLIDVDDALATGMASLLTREIAFGREEAQVAFRDGKRYLARLVATPERVADDDAGPDAVLRVPTDGPSRLTLSSAGSIDSLQLTTMSREAPSDDQIEIAVRATGLNFSDVLKALGLYPGITDDVVPMGIECSGIVASVGPQVDRFEVGDEVLGVVPYGFATHAVTSEFAVVKKPGSLSHEEAATVPIAFMTAHHALHHLAQLQAGERVLIHAGAGGVGQAAIQIAQSLGAEVFATAGSDGKREFLQSLGVPHVLNSRTLEFADRIRELTAGEGVDVVLNSLPGEAIDRSLSVLRAFGRFLEIGKTDIYQNRAVGLSPFQDNLSYFAIDLDRMLRQRPEGIRKLFGEVMSHFESGDYQPPPLTTFAFRETRDAFRYMAQRKNIGKVVVSLDDMSGRTPDLATAEPPGTYLITGGLGALGLQVADSLRQRGIECVALLSRRSVGDDKQKAIDRLRRHGLNVCVLQGDVADQASLNCALQQIPDDFPPLTGVIHAAGVLDDGVLFDMNGDRLENAIRPKVAGSWNLHCATLDSPIQEFLMFSSIASMLGSPGQGNYAAGNAFLDSFASYRRSQGLPATTINWGPWADGGMATQDDRAAQLSGRGMDLLPASDSLDLMRHVVDHNVEQVAVMRPHWDELLKSYRGSIPSLLQEIHSGLDVDASETSEGVDQDFRRQLISAGETDRRSMLREYFKRQLAVIMGLSDECLDEEQPLNSMGLDSLMAIELKNQVETRLGVVLPMARFMEGPSVASLATAVAQLVVERDVSSLADQHDEGRDRFPLSFGQQSLWFLHRLAPESAAYHICDAVRVQGPLSMEVLQKTTQSIVDRHAAFRTTFHDDQGRPFQKVHDSWPVAIDTIDAGEWSQSQIDAAVTDHLSQPFDLESGPLLRVTVFAIDDQTHVLLFCVHHIVADFWSLVACTQEFKEIYTALRAGQELQVPTSTIDYGRFVQWQQDMLASDEGRQHWEYWKDQLAGELPVLDLPTDRARPQVQTFKGDLAFRWLDSELTARLRQLAEEQGATLNMLLLAAYQLLLHRHSGQDDVIVGLPTSGRARAEFSPLVGYFVNPVPIRGSMAEDPTFLEFLTQIRERTIGALEHQDYPLSLLVDRLNPERDSGRSAMFQAAFVMQKAQVLHEQGLTPFLMGQSGATLEVSDLMFESMTLEQWVAQLDLSLAASEADGGTSLGLQYNTDLFDDSTAERLLEHFETILRDVANRPGKRLSQVELLSQVERDALDSWNDTASEPRDRELVHQRIEQQAKETPDAIAVVCGTTTLTYRELDERANRLAHYLRDRGAKRNDRIGICLDRDENLIVAIQAILRSGAAYVPLDPTYPSARLREIANSAGMSILVTTTCHSDAIAEFEGIQVCLDGDREAIEAQSSDSIDCHGSSDDLIYVIYTSGSTGTPKGAGVYHRGFKNLIDWYVEDLGVGAEDRCLVITSHGFDLTQKNLYASLMTGGELHLSRCQVYDPVSVRSEIDAAKITVLNCTPSHIYGIADPNSDQLEALESLRLVILGGEQIDLTKLQAWSQHDGFQAEIVNSYGPTECTDVVVYHRIGDPRLHLSEGVPLGRPIRNVQFAILDKHLGVVPLGSIGELCLSGKCIGAGYINDEELTSQRFVEWPIVGTTTEPRRMYRTGDLCRVREDGLIEFVGRRDHQIKLRGFRIELGEIEQTLAAHDSVREVVVVVREDVPGGLQLVAYVVADDSTEVRDLIDFTKQTLPSHMVPTTCVRLAEIPLTTHGKLDRRSLPIPDQPQIADRDYMPPESIAEQAVAEVWSELLNQSRVGKGDNFFELGGDSLLSIEAVSRLRRTGWVCTPAQVFQHQSLGDLAAVLVRPAEQSDVQASATGNVALSPIQHWFFELGLQQPAHFNQSILLEVPAGLRHDSLQRAVEALIEHHDGLRSRFRSNDATGWTQEILDKESSTPIQFVDLTQLDEQQQKIEIEQICDDVQNRLNLQTGPLVRVVHFELGKNRPARLLMTAHHLVIDPFSWRVLLGDLLTAYQQRLGSQTIQLPPKTTPIRTWNERLRQVAQSDTMKSELSQWHSLIDATNPQALARDMANGENTFGSAESLSVSLNVEETDAFQRTCSAAANESTVCLLTALGHAMKDWQGRNVLVDVERHGRETTNDDVTRTVGWFVTAHPFATDYQANSTLLDNLTQTRKRWDAVPGTGAGYGLLRYMNEQSEVREAISNHAAVDMRLNYLGLMEHDDSIVSGFRLAPEKCGNHQPDQSIRPHVLEVDARIREGRLLIEWTFSRNCHRRDTINRLAELSLNWLRKMLLELGHGRGD
ncbi:MAG: amino acid adenylation domain-containing protein [Rubripirellula sp.]